MFASFATYIVRDRIRTRDSVSTLSRLLDYLHCLTLGYNAYARAFSIDWKNSNNVVLFCRDVFFFFSNFIKCYKSACRETGYSHEKKKFTLTRDSERRVMCNIISRMKKKRKNIHRDFMLLVL